MPVDFPTSPTVNQLYQNQGITWRWNGTAWDAVGITSGVINPVTTGKAIAMSIVFGG